MAKKTVKIKGIITALGTPLTNNESLHEKSFRKLIRAQIDGGIHGFLIGGTFGVMQLLKDETYEDMIRVGINETNGRIPALIGCGDCSTERTIARVRVAERYKPDGLAILSPYFFQHSQEELYQHFKKVAESTDLPVFPYDNPGVTKNHLDFETVVKLSKIENIVGIKDSNFDLVTMRRLKEEFGDNWDFLVINGLTMYMDMLMYLGFPAHLDGIFCLYPELIVDFYKAGLAGDKPKIMKYQEKILRIFRGVFLKGLWPSVTAGMNLLGFEGNFAPRPFTQPTKEIRKYMQKFLKEEDLL
jgi:4-hydroxy-tetrahydrodipicolinate synthase